jgi:pimeloyl-ACP methyl ester carboxylesterase
MQYPPRLWPTIPPCGRDTNVADFSLDAWVADLEAVVAASDLRRFPLMGLSQGGAVAIAYAVRHPEQVSQLVLVGRLCARDIGLIAEQRPRATFLVQIRQHGAAPALFTARMPSASLASATARRQDK